MLGFDSELSRDHDWGPKLTIFVSSAEDRELVLTALCTHVPETFESFQTRPAMHEDGTQDFSVAAGHKGIPPAIEVTMLASFLQRRFGVSIEDARCFDASNPSSWTLRDWLRVPSQELLCVSAGSVFHDGSGALSGFRQQLAVFYPPPVLAYLLASGWHIIGQESHLMSRAGHSGDELGSALIGATLCRCLMRMAFLYARQYAPYQKWFGTAFRRLPIAEHLSDDLNLIVTATDWQAREAAVGRACCALARIHRQSPICRSEGEADGESLPSEVTKFWSRPFNVFPTQPYVDSLLAQVQRAEVESSSALPRPPIGSVDFWSDHTDVRESGYSAAGLRKLFS